MHDFELEQEQTRIETASYLQQLADGLRQGNKVTLVAGDESATINPPERLRVRLETSTDSAWLGGDEGRSFHLELGWEADEEEADDELTIIYDPDRAEPGGSAQPASR